MFKWVFSFAIFFIAGSLYIPSLHAGTRWYSEQQVKSGEKLFAENCASCHGKKAEGTREWKKKDANGKLPPPPLDGTAHAWHHPINILRRTVREGSIKIGGSMPAFKDRLSEQQTDSVIAWVQSRWSDKVYAAWSERNGPMTPSGEADSQPAQSLSKLILSTANPSPVEGIVQSKYGNQYIYATKDGRYGFAGDLIDLQTGENLTERLRKHDRLALLKKFKSEDMAVLPAKGKEKAQITIFTDTSCPFCRKLHKEVPQLIKAGVTVRYIPFSRGGKEGRGYEDLRSVWCSKDRAAAMDIAKGTEKGILGFGDCKAADAVDKGYQFGIEIGLRGTPAIVMPDGNFLQGYRPAKKLLKMLKIK